MQVIRRHNPCGDSEGPLGAGLRNDRPQQPYMIDQQSSPTLC